MSAAANMYYQIFACLEGTWSYSIFYEDGSLADMQDGFATKHEAQAACFDSLINLTNSNKEFSK